MAVGAGLAAGLPYFIVAAITAVLFGMDTFMNVCTYVCAWMHACMGTHGYVSA